MPTAVISGEFLLGSGEYVLDNACVLCNGTEVRTYRDCGDCLTGSIDRGCAECVETRDATVGAMGILDGDCIGWATEGYDTGVGEGFPDESNDCRVKSLLRF